MHLDGQEIANKAALAGVSSGGLGVFLTDNMQLFSFGIAVISLIVSILFYTLKTIETRRFNNETLKLKRLELGIDENG